MPVFLWDMALGHMTPGLTQTYLTHPSLLQLISARAIGHNTEHPFHCPQSFMVPEGKNPDIMVLGFSHHPSSAQRSSTCSPKWETKVQRKNSRHIWDKLFPLLQPQKCQALPVSFWKPYRLVAAISFSLPTAITRSLIHHILNSTLQIYLSGQRNQIKNETTISLAW